MSVPLKQEKTTMQIAIRTRRFSLSTSSRSLTERYLRMALGREPFRVSAATLYLRPAGVYGGTVELVAKLVVRSPRFKQITVSDAGTQLGPMLIRLVRRARHIGRTRLKRRIHLGRRSADRFATMVQSGA